jgi:NAD dependent epimerase/dehydratase family enzyme
MWLLDTPIRGPVNLVAPAALTNRAFTAALARHLHRPAHFRIPSRALSLALGTELVTGALLASQRVSPSALESSGFKFADPDIQSIISSALA